MLIKHHETKGWIAQQYKESQQGRFLYINAWRNISDTPIGNDHLAVCDETSLVKPDDYIVTDFFDKEYRFENYDCDVKIDDYDP